MPPGTTGRTYSFNLTSPTGVFKATTFTQLNTSTPKAVFNSSVYGTIQPNTETTIVLNNTVVPMAIAKTIQLYSISNPLFVYDVSTWTTTLITYTDGTTMNQLSFKVTLNSGKYGFRIYDENLGWYTATITLTVQKATGTTYAAVLTSTSFNGGTFKITGDHIGDGATIKVNGVKGTVISRTSS